MREAVSRDQRPGNVEVFGSQVVVLVRVNVALERGKDEDAGEIVVVPRELFFGEVAYCFVGIDKHKESKSLDVVE